MGSGIPYPFAKYSFIILPGFQYGGMEHTGATLYNDTRMFLSEHPTLDEELARAKLIAHESQTRRSTTYWRHLLPQELGKCSPWKLQEQRGIPGITGFLRSPSRLSLLAQE